MKTKLYRCANCNFETDDGDSLTPWWEVDGILNRLDTNGIVPYSVCPECGSLVDKYDDVLLLYDAAKELLEACLLVVRELEVHHATDCVCKVCQCVRAAIAKAKGTPDA